jgi:hypothetical protein
MSRERGGAAHHARASCGDGLVAALAGERPAAITRHTTVVRRAET